MQKKSFPNKISFVQQDKTIISKIYAVIFRNLISNKIFIHNLLRKYDYTVYGGITETDYMFLVFKTYFVFYFLYKKISVRTEMFASKLFHF